MNLLSDFGHDLFKVLALHGELPRRIHFFLMEGKPPNENLHLLLGERTYEQFSIHADGCLKPLILGMNVRFVMPLVITIAHAYHQCADSVQFTHWKLFLSLCEQRRTLYHNSTYRRWIK